MHNFFLLLDFRRAAARRQVPLAASIGILRVLRSSQLYASPASWSNAMSTARWPDTSKPTEGYPLNESSDTAVSLLRDFGITVLKRVMPAILGVFSASILSGCAGQAAPPPARPADRYIYVTTQGLPGECYTDLGTVEVSQSFADAAVDQDQSGTAKRLRATALELYPDDVDAVIDVQSHQNDAGTDVISKGEAVRLENHPTVQCTLRESEGAMDAAAVMGAGGIAGATVGGLVGGAALATSLGISGAAAMGARTLVQHEAAKEQQQEEFKKTLGEQRREIAQLLKQRAQLLKCQESEVPLKVCLASPSSSTDSSQDQSENAGPNDNMVDASPFEIRKHLQEQQDYIKQLQEQIEHIEWQMAGH